MKIAVAASGLAHIKRGIETWAQDVGAALRRAGLDATTFQGSADANGPNGVVVGCWQRYEPRTLKLVRTFSGKGGWRIGLGTGYEVEQTTFALRLFRLIRKDYDILHVQDPRVALIMEGFHRKGLSRPKVIMAHGTEEEAAVLKKYSYLQHLAPNYLEDWRPHQPAGQMTFAIPNLVDTAKFQPGDKAAARALCDLPQNALVILSVGALNMYHKRVDYLIEEFAAWRKTYPGKAVLVVAGARENETAAVHAVAAKYPPDEVIILENQPRGRVLELMQAADVFSLASRHEMMGIAVLEALSTGLPLACNATPTLTWMAGEAGRLTDISETGALAAQFAVLADPGARALMAGKARERAEQLFSERAVVSQMVEMYERVLA